MKFIFFPEEGLLKLIFPGKGILIIIFPLKSLWNLFSEKGLREGQMPYKSFFFFLKKVLVTIHFFTRQDLEGICPTKWFFEKITHHNALFLPSGFVGHLPYKIFFLKKLPAIMYFFHLLGLIFEQVSKFDSKFLSNMTTDLFNFDDIFINLRFVDELKYPLLVGIYQIGY